jgi:hypothetical protein
MAAVACRAGVSTILVGQRVGLVLSVRTDRKNNTGTDCCVRSEGKRMSFESVETLKKQLTDKYVVADVSTAELRRFEGLTGVVKTVNMSGKALVQFDNPVDISWYDIDPAYLTVVDQPVKKAPPAKAAAPAEKKVVPAAKPAAKPAGKSPLELARAQAAAAKAGGAPAGDKPLSKIELARQQAAKAGGSPAASSKPSDGKPLSKIELARQQAAAAKKPAAEPVPAAVESQVESSAAAAVEEPPAAEPVAPPPAAKPAANTEGLSKLELARRQGAFKG